MASFCRNCGAPVSGRFCTRCGTAVQESAVQGDQEAAIGATPQMNPAPPPVGRTGSGAKILFIVLGVVLLLGAAGVTGVVYVGYRAKQKFAELKKDYGVESASNTTSSTRKFPPSQGSGCKMLEGQEAAQILGVAVERVEFEQSSPDGSSTCRYWVSAAERQHLIKEEIGSSLAGMSKAGSNTDQQDFEKLIGGAAGAMIEANGDNKDTDYAFSLQIWSKNGKQQWEKMQSTQSRAKDAMGADLAGVAMRPIQGIGDSATELAAGHSIMVLKGDAFFLLGFQQFVPGREKTAALARIVAGRI